MNTENKIPKITWCLSRGTSNKTLKQSKMSLFKILLKKKECRRYVYWHYYYYYSLGSEFQSHVVEGKKEFLNTSVMHWYSHFFF